MRDETISIHTGYETDPTTKSVAVPIHQTVAYEFDDAQHGADLFDLAVPGNIYSRIMNPTNDVLEQRVANLEGGVGALAASSGHGSQTLAFLTILEQGDHIVASSRLYGGSFSQFNYMFPRLGITTTFVSPDDPEGFAAAISTTRVLSRK